MKRFFMYSALGSAVPDQTVRPGSCLDALPGFFIAPDAKTFLEQGNRIWNCWSTFIDLSS
jgi:hypothetical protein